MGASIPSPDLRRPPAGRPMGVLQIVPRMDHGGVERAAVDISRALVARGVNSVLATAGGRLCADVALDGGRIALLPVHSKSPLTMAGNVLRLRRLIRDARIDLVHVRSRAPALSAVLAARWAGVPIVSTYHGIYGARSAFKRAYNGLLTRVDRVMVNSLFTQAHVSREHGVPPHRMRLVPEAVDEVRFRPLDENQAAAGKLRRTWSPDGRRILLCPARLTRWKGQALLIEAFARGAPSDWRLVVVGDAQGRTAYREELERLVALNGVADKVLFAGDHADMPLAYSACDVVALPSLKPESFGRSAVEAQLMKRPVVVSDHGAFQETVIEGGVRLAAGNMRVWEEGLSWFLAHPPEAHHAMGRAGRRSVERAYNMEGTVQKTMECYAEALAEVHDRRSADEIWLRRAGGLGGLIPDDGAVCVIDGQGIRPVRGSLDDDLALVFLPHDADLKALAEIRSRLGTGGVIAIRERGFWFRRGARRKALIASGLYVSARPLRAGDISVWILTRSPQKDDRPRDGIGRVATDYLRLAPFWLTATGLG